MESFTKKERIVILVVVFIIILSLSFKVFIGKRKKPTNMVIQLDSTENEDQQESEVIFETEDYNEEIMVHISGEVYKPGIIVLESGKRLIDATELAGGLKKDADLDRINLLMIPNA